MKKILLFGVFFCYFFDGNSQNDIPKKDVDEIRALVRKKIQKSLPELMNTLNLDDVGEAERKNVILNSYLPSTDQLFAGDGVIVEDDLNPDRNASDRPIDLTIGKYFNNFDLFYKKSENSTFEISNVVVSEVKKNEGQIYVKVYYRSIFKGEHKKITTAFKPQERVAEFKAEKIEKKWEVLITRIAFYISKKEETPKVTALNNVSSTKIVVEKDILKTPTIVVEKPKEEPIITQKSVNEVKSPIPPTKINSSPVLEALQAELSSSKSKKVVLKVLGLGALGSAVGIFAAANGKYSDYVAKVEKNNTTYTNWYRVNLNGQTPPSDELAKPISMSEYTSPSIVPIGGAVVVGLGLFLWGNKYGKIAHETKAKIEKIQKNTSFTPKLDIFSGAVGFNISYKF